MGSSECSLGVIASPSFEGRSNLIAPSRYLGSAEGQSPFARGLGVSPSFNFPQDWGIKGVENGLLNATSN